MDASCKIQGSIHSFFLVHNMCPELWVHIILGGAFFMPKYSKDFKLKIVLEHQNEKIGWVQFIFQTATV